MANIETHFRRPTNTATQRFLSPPEKGYPFVLHAPDRADGISSIVAAVVRSKLETPPMTGWGLIHRPPQIKANPGATDDAAADDERNGKTDTKSPLRNVAAHGKALK